MDAFETIVCSVMREKGYWVERNVKVKISPKEKEALGKPTMPTPEIDIVAYNPRRSELLLIECKSFLDSSGVKYNDVVGKSCSKRNASRYKLLNNPDYQKVISDRLIGYLLEKGMINQPVNQTIFGLAAGKVYETKRSNNCKKLRNYLEGRDHFYLSPVQVRAYLNGLTNHVYKNDVVNLTVKILAA